MLFISTYLLLSITWPEFSHFTNTISDLGSAKAPNAYTWNLFGYIGPGLLLSFFSIGFHKAVSRGNSNRISFLALFFSGIFLALAGIFPENFDGSSTSTMFLHTFWIIGSGLAFLVAAFTYPTQLKKSPFWNKTIIPSLIFAWSCILSAFLRMGQAPGIGQRIGFLCYFLWIGYLAFNLYRFEQIQGA